MTTPASGPRRSPTARAEPGPQTLGHYEIESLVGYGGMATVYQARDTRLGRTVAIKLLDVPGHLPPAEIEALVGRMRREARAIGSLSHPNVVGILDIGEENGLPFLVMEYLDGVTLRQHLDTHGPLALDTAAVVLSQIAQALEAAHARDLLHRDIKPSNVMLLAGDAANEAGGVPGARLPHVKLLDFGIARQIGDTMVTRTGLMVGSPAYMAPETIRGEGATRAADIWSLGALLYEILAGRAAFAGDTIPAVFYQILEQPSAPLPGVSANVSRVLARALEKTPDKRFASATELADAFRAASAAPSGVAAPPITKTRLGRRRTAITLGVGSAAALLALALLLPPRLASRGSTPPLSPFVAARSPAGQNRSPRLPAPVAATSVTRLPVLATPTRPSRAATRRPDPEGVGAGSPPVPVARPAPTRRRPATSRPASPAPPRPVRSAPPRNAGSVRVRPKRGGETSGVVRARPAESSGRRPARSPRPAPATKTVVRQNKKRPPTGASLLAQKVRLARNYVRLRREAGRVDLSNPKAVAAYNRKVNAFRATQQHFNAAVRKGRRGAEGGRRNGAR